MKKERHFLILIILTCWATFPAGCMIGTAFRCPDCKGQANSTFCSTCWGEGLRLEEEKVSFQRCPTCLGTGQNQTMFRPAVDQVLARFASICPSCSGRGQKKIVTPIRVHCKRCDGTGEGKTPVICGRCSGTGKWKSILRSGKNRKGWISPPSEDGG